MLKREILQLFKTLYNKRFCKSDDMCRVGLRGDLLQLIVAMLVRVLQERK